MSRSLEVWYLPGSTRLLRSLISILDNELCRGRWNRTNPLHLHRRKETRENKYNEHHESWKVKRDESRNVSKFKQRELATNCMKHLSNCLKHEKEGVNNSKIQKEARMEELEEHWNGLQLWFLKTCEPNSFQSSLFMFSTLNTMLGRHYKIEQLL